MRNDDENKNMIQATVEDGILHIHTPRKAGFIMENAKATGQKTFRSIEWRQRVKWSYRSSSFGGINWTMTLLKCIPFTELRSSDLVRRRRGEFAALSVWTFPLPPWADCLLALYLMKQQYLRLPPRGLTTQSCWLWRHPGGRKDRSLSESWNKKRCYFKCLFRQWQKKEKKKWNAHILFSSQEEGNKEPNDGPISPLYCLNSLCDHLRGYWHFLTDEEIWEHRLITSSMTAFSSHEATHLFKGLIQCISITLSWRWETHKEGKPEHGQHLKQRRLR